MLGLQRAISLIYPDQCVLCPSMVDHVGGLCGTCWRETPFLNGLVCNTCGTSLPGDDESGRALCDDCMVVVRPWEAGRAAFAYAGNGRRIVLTLKHGDRPELAEPAARWLAKAGADILMSETLLVPIPVHWTRLLRRRYNQAAELSRALSKLTGLEAAQDGLVRTRRTVMQDGMNYEQRQMNMANALSVNPKSPDVLAGRRVCLVDDVMTSGATLSAATVAAYDAGADQVFVIVLARVEKTP